MTPLIRMNNISKRFGRVAVLRDVSFDILPGETHILAGENGAGKSTLMKILGGVYSEFDGVLEVEGRPRRFNTPLEANAAGIAVIYQELSLIPAMTVTENIFVGRNRMTRGGFVRGGQQRDLATALLDRLGLDVDVTRRIEQLPIAQQQLVEIAKALAQDARVIVMDEPTSSLNTPEVAKLFALIRDLTARGCGIVYISHKMEEIEQIGDRITVLRDGQYIGTAPVAELPISTLLHWMVGRETQEQFPRATHHRAVESPPRLTVRDLTVRPAGANAKAVVDEISFEIQPGEIVGIGGLQGSGASEMLWGLFGAYGSRAVQGEVWLNERSHRIRSPRDSIDRGVALLTNDRKASGLVLPLSVVANTTLSSLHRVCRGGWRSGRFERAIAEPLARSFALRASSLDVAVAALSGGNQQKVAIAKWLATDPTLLLLDEPTRGIDIGAKRDIYRLMDQWTAEGKSVLLITSELPELLALSDRILVMHRGQITATFDRAEATPDRVMEAAMGRTEPVGST